MDTNAIVSLLAGNRDLSAQLAEAEYVGIPVISFLAFDGLSEADRACFNSFCKRVEIVSLSHDDSQLMKQALELRSKHRLKLPDAIIGATALSRTALPVALCRFLSELIGH